MAPPWWAALLVRFHFYFISFRVAQKTVAKFRVIQCKSHASYCKEASALMFNYQILIKVGGGTCCRGGSSSNTAHMWNRLAKCHQMPEISTETIFVQSRSLFCLICHFLFVFEIWLLWPWRVMIPTHYSPSVRQLLMRMTADEIV